MESPACSLACSRNSCSSSPNGQYFKISPGLNRPFSRVAAPRHRICCRFLMHRKMKSRLADTLKTDDELRAAIFGELNTYKYSLVFLFRRLIRLNETELTEELLSLLKNNPYRDDSAKDYSDRWSLRFIIDEALRAPDDYLDLSEENKNVIDEARKGL